MKKTTISQSKYDEKNTVKYTLKLNCKTDSDIIKSINDIVLKQGTSKQGAIKYLIRNSEV